MLVLETVLVMETCAYNRECAVSVLSNTNTYKHDTGESQHATISRKTD